MDPQVAKHVSYRHRPLPDSYLSTAIRKFVEQLCQSQDITANEDHIARHSTGTWAPTLEDFRFDWTGTCGTALNKAAIHVVTQGILDDIAKGRYIEMLVDTTLTFPSLRRKVRGHFEYLRRKVQKANAENDKGIEADVDAKQRIRRRERRKGVRSACWIAMKQLSNLPYRNMFEGFRLQMLSRTSGESSSHSYRESPRSICLTRRVTWISLEPIISPSAPPNSAHPSSKTFLIAWTSWMRNWLTVERIFFCIILNQNMRGALQKMAWHQSNHLLGTSLGIAMMPSGW